MYLLFHSLDVFTFVTLSNALPPTLHIPPLIPPLLNNITQNQLLNTTLPSLGAWLPLPFTLPVDSTLKLKIILFDLLTPSPNMDCTQFHQGCTNRTKSRR